LVKNGDATGGRQVFARAIERVRSLQELQNVCSQLVQALEFEDAKGLIQDAGKSLDPVWMNMALASQELEHRQFAEAARRLGTLALPAGDTALNHERDLMLAMSLYQVGEYDQARSLYEKLVAAQPDVRTLNNLAYLLVDHYADPKAALPLAQQAAAMAPNTASVLDTLGWIQFKNGQLEQARLTLERSMGIRPLPVTSLHLGQVYAQQNIPARARELLTQAVDLAIVSGETDVRQQANQLLDQIGQAE
jgi:tetratricopeptide (TPR) repeat protein